MKIQRWVSTIVFLAFLAGARGQTFKTVKTWTFDLPHGTLSIQLQSSSDGLSSLGIGPNRKLPEAPIAEQVEPLKQVLSEMPNLGLDPRSLSYIGMGIFDEEVRKQLAYACADSKEWRLSMRIGGKGKEDLMVALLNQSKVYEPYNEVFKSYGIRARVTAAEKVALIRLSAIPPRDSRDRANAKMWVAADAILGMRFSQVDSNSQTPGSK